MGLFSSSSTTNPQKSASCWTVNFMAYLIQTVQPEHKKSPVNTTGDKWVIVAKKYFQLNDSRIWDSSGKDIGLFRKPLSSVKDLALR